MRSALIAIISLGLMAGCSDTSVSVPTTTAADAIGPGVASVSAEEAALSFKSVCADTFPDAAKATSVLEARGFNQKPSTGTFYDQRRNLSYSVKKMNGSPACSMVFSSKSDQAIILALLTSADPRARISRVGAQSQDGGVYYRALLKSE